ncbi:MAG TPA: hypothetical protein VM223_06090 [Planctomycetota bacterium]|nr:hypothetical protein [Planctomycetota bacterium]
MTIRSANRIPQVSLFIAGACSTSGQVILLRELMAAYQGNELSLGVILAAWLVWGAAGSWIAGRLADRVAHPVRLYAAALAAAAILLPATVFASALIRRLSGVGPVEMIGFAGFLWSAALLLAPLCFVQGGFFALGSRILAGQKEGRGEPCVGPRRDCGGASAIGPGRTQGSPLPGAGAGRTEGSSLPAARAYLLESSGAGAGGVAVSLFVINHLAPMSLAAGLSLCLVVCVVLLVACDGGSDLSCELGKRRRLAVIVFASLLGLVFARGLVTSELDGLRWGIAWKPMTLLEARNSLHGSIAAVAVDGQPSIYEDGQITATAGSRLAAEELVHVGLATASIAASEEEEGTGNREQGAKNREQGTRSREEGRGNREEGTRSREEGRGNREQGTGIREQGTGIREQGTGKQEQGTRSREAILLIGGGLSGCLQEILKHDVQRVDYVELDPQVIEMARRHLPAEDVLPLSDPRVHVWNVDARYFVKTPGPAWDAVLMDLPGPRGARLNRMYSMEFFAELKRRLNPGGVVVFGVPGSEVYPSPEQRLMLASLRKTALAVFAHVNVLPGETSLFVLSDSPLPEPDAGPILARLDELGIETVYVRREMLPFQLSRAKAEGLRKSLDRVEGRARLNLDFEPVGYLYGLAEWAAHFRSGPARWLWAVINAGSAWFYAVPSAILILLGTGIVLARRSATGLAVAVGGLSHMVFQIVVLIGFQILYGYLFYRVGLMVGVFMGGLAIGCVLVRRQAELSSYHARRGFLLVQAALCLYPLAIPVFFRLQPPSPVFMLLPLIAGIVGGMQLPLAVRLLTDGRRDDRTTGRRDDGEKQDAAFSSDDSSISSISSFPSSHHPIISSSPSSLGRTAGWLYGMDLLGACVGALLAGPILVPSLGLVGICVWVAMINIIVLAVMAVR